MSAINEWFGSYNSTFTYILRTYGQEELDRYLQYLADVPACDLSEAYRKGGLEAVEADYAKNFRMDGDETSVRTTRTADQLTMEVRCPAFFNAPEAPHADKQVGDFFCSCCAKLNKGILANAGFDLDIRMTGKGTCVWTVQPK